ncbi:hypothetical protein J2R89_006375 [Bradyrhizobium elkanii]|nr:hypothetical protein [Bradyrhizobium elkanii]
MRSIRSGFGRSGHLGDGNPFEIYPPEAST